MYNTNRKSTDSWVEWILTDVNKRETVEADDRYYGDCDVSQSRYMDSYRESKDAGYGMY